eukprot:GILI01012310.1.p1 GENE.GILI01012310.1~~GILI01012310.1.p1  ORF type:complete len:506 (+),score=123.34 GILI01012310.1:96-1613(+)
MYNEADRLATNEHSTAAAEHNSVGLLSGVNFNRSKYHDVCFSITFGVLTVASIILGLAMTGSMIDASSEFKKCAEIEKAKTGTADAGEAVSPFDSSAVGYLFLFVILSFVLGALWLYVFRKFTRCMVMTTVISIGVILVCIGAICLRLSPIVGGIILCVAILWFVSIFTCLKETIEFTTRLLHEACNVLQSYPTILGGSVLILLVEMIFVGAFVVFCVAGALHGHVKLTSTGCELVQPDWIGAYIFWFIFMTFWVMAVCHNVQMGFISTVSGIWYFKEESLVPAGSQPVSLALKWNATVNFGSHCFGALVVAIIQLIQAIVHEARRKAEEEGANVVAKVALCCLDCIVACIKDAIEFINKYATIFVGISGNDFIKSAQEVFNMLSRNGLMTVTVDGLSTFVLVFNALGLAVFMCLVTLTAVTASTGMHSDKAAFITVISFFVCFLIFYFLADNILSIVSALWVCFAHDRSRDQVSQPGLHDIFSIRAAKIKPIRPPAVIGRPNPF